MINFLLLIFNCNFFFTELHFPSQNDFYKKQCWLDASEYVNEEYFLCETEKISSPHLDLILKSILLHEKNFSAKEELLLAHRCNALIQSICHYQKLLPYVKISLKFEKKEKRVEIEGRRSLLWEVTEHLENIITGKKFSIPYFISFYTYFFTDEVKLRIREECSYYRDPEIQDTIAKNTTKIINCLPLSFIDNKTIKNVAGTVDKLPAIFYACILITFHDDLNYAYKSKTSFIKSKVHLLIDVMKAFNILSKSNFNFLSIKKSYFLKNSDPNRPRHVRATNFKKILMTAKSKLSPINSLKCILKNHEQKIKNIQKIKELQKKIIKESSKKMPHTSQRIRFMAMPSAWKDRVANYP